MGDNTTVIFLNDAINALPEDADFGRRLYHAILAVGAFTQSDRRFVRVGNHGGACAVVESHHADQTTLVAVGGNSATKVFQTFGDRDHHTDEGQERLLRDWADKMGFRLVRKRAKKKAPVTVLSDTDDCAESCEGCGACNQ